MTNDEFIKKALESHKIVYDYSKVEYKDCKTPVTIICPIHGEFRQRPDSHLRGAGCPKCNKRRAKDTEWFIEEFMGIGMIILKQNIRDAKKN